MISRVGDNLDTAIGKIDTVRTLEVSVVVLSFGLFEVGTGVVISNTVLVSEGLRGQFFFFVGGGVVRSGGGFVGGGGSIRSWWGTVWAGNSHGKESGKNGGLHSWVFWRCATVARKKRCGTHFSFSLNFFLSSSFSARSFATAKLKRTRTRPLNSMKTSRTAR